MVRELVEQAKRGDEEAFDALARRAGDQCMAIACWILRDVSLAEDAVQVAFVRAWREIRALRDPDRFEAWLHRILVNECYAEARRRRRWSARIGLLPAEGGRRDGIDDVAVRDQLHRAFLRLTIEQRTVMVFHHYLGLTLPEVAARLGIPLGTAKSRLHYATEALRASIDADARADQAIGRQAG